MRYLIVLFTALFLSVTAEAQISIHLGFNIDRQPVWGPTGYDHVEYYYLPDIDAYYYVPGRRFYYFERNRWVSSASLPRRYRDYDLYNSYKVVVNEPHPYQHDKIYRDKYFSYRGRHDQQVIRDSRDEKYFINENHPDHRNWIDKQRHDQRNDRKRKHDDNDGKH